MHSQHRVLLARFELVFAQTTIAISITVSKYLFTIFPIHLLLCIRFALGTLFLALFVFYKKHALHITKYGRKINNKDLAIFFAQALCGGFLFNMLMAPGLKYTTATMAGIICSTVPAVLAVFSWFILKEKLSRNQLIAIALAVFGLLLLAISKESTEYASNALLGDLLILIAVIPEALFTIITKWYGDHIEPLVLALYVCFFNTLLFLPLALIELNQFHFNSISLGAWGLVLIFALMVALFFSLWYHGLEHHSASTAALVTAYMPVATAILAIIFLQENLSMVEILSMSLVICSIIYGSKTSVHIN